MTATSADPSAFWNPGPLLTSVTSPHPMMPQRMVRKRELGEQFLDDVAVNVGEPELTALELVGEFRVVEPHQVKDGRVEIVHFHGVLDDVVAEVVRFSNRDARFDAAAGHPDGERPRVVI